MDPRAGEPGEAPTLPLHEALEQAARLAAEHDRPFAVVEIVGDGYQAVEAQDLPDLVELATGLAGALGGSPALAVTHRVYPDGRIEAV